MAQGPQSSQNPRLIPREASFWCTGEDSNLRTSLGGTDLQSVGFNHSPTCAKTFRATLPITLRPADRVCKSQAFFQNLRRKRSKSNFKIHSSLSQYRETKVAHKNREEYYSPEKFRRECVLEKPVAPLLLGPPPAGQFLLRAAMLAVELVSGAGEGIRTPDPLITNQMLYRLSYASNWGKARLRANLSHGSLPDVRDNYIKYHTRKLRRNGSLNPLAVTTATEG